MITVSQEKDNRPEQGVAALNLRFEDEQGLDLKVQVGVWCGTSDHMQINYDQLRLYIRGVKHPMLGEFEKTGGLYIGSETKNPQLTPLCHLLTQLFYEAAASVLAERNWSYEMDPELDGALKN